MYKRKWTITDTDLSNTTTSKITIYDAGAYSYEYLEIDGKVPRLFSWEVINREKMIDGTIIETLSAIHDEWIPFDTISSESYPVRLIESGYEIPGWKIQSIQDFKEQNFLKDPKQNEQNFQKDLKQQLAHQPHEGKVVKQPGLIHKKVPHLKHVIQVDSGAVEVPAPKYGAHGLQMPQKHRVKQLLQQQNQQPSLPQLQPHLEHSPSIKKDKMVNNSLLPSQDPSQKDQASQKQHSSQYQKRLEAYLVPRVLPSDRTEKVKGAL